MNAALPDWTEANQRYLSAALARVRRRLEAADGAQPGVQADIRAGARTDALSDETHIAMSSPSALELLCSAFRLSDFERDVLLLCAGVELDARYGPLVAKLSPERRQATFALALAALANPHWSALAPVGPLRRWRLVELGEGQSVTTSALRIDERILHFLTGVSYLDDRLQGIMETVGLVESLAPSRQRQADCLAAAWRRTRANEPAATAQICGADHRSRAAVAAAAADRLGLRLLLLAASEAPASGAERAALARLCDRELILGRCALLLDCESLPAGAAGERSIAAFAGALSAPVAISCRDPLRFERGLSERIELERLPSEERRAIWRSALGPLAGKLNGQFESLSAQFALDETQIGLAAARVADGGEDGDALAARLWDACREQARTGLGGLAQRLPAVATWDDLVLPEPQLAILRQIAVHVRQGAKVYEAWGFEGKGARGLGIGALFSGASGTGKTMAAEVLANDLSLDLFHIDLSQVVSKYIGETEKNLGRIFDAAEECRAILLFDEADALFGKRSEVKDSHDRYANIEVSYLLQRMEAYRGLAILTTNMKSALDPAFSRRLRFAIQFPFPDARQRNAIWRGVFPRQTPTRALDWDRLARLEIPGGNIRGIALNAAFLAAEDGEAVAMTHLRRAAESEYAKLEKPLTAAEIGSWP